MIFLKRVRNLHYGLRFQILLVCFIISVLPIIAIQIIFYNLSRYYMEQKIDTLSNANLSYIKTNIESDLEYYKEILYRMDTDDTIIQNEVNFNNGGEFTREISKIKLRDSLASYACIRDEISEITFINSSLNSVFYDKQNISSENYFWDSYSEEEKKQIYNEIHNSNSIVILNTMHYNYTNEDHYLYNIGIRAWDIETGEDLGIVILSVNEKQLDYICNVEANNDKVKEYSFVVDDKGQVISFPDKQCIGTYIKITNQNNYDVTRLLKLIPFSSADGVIINSVSIEESNWRVINLVDKNSMFFEINILWKLTMGISAFIILLCIVVITVFSNKFSGTVNKIVKEIKKAKKGDFDAHIKLNGNHELVFIGNEFNGMIKTISGLVENLSKKNDYIYEISNKRREAEINAIVAQINPHFLYNTLDCINWKAIETENYEISEMVSKLAHILRYGMRNINEQVTIYEEVDWLEKYLYLYKIRFNNSFRSEFDVNDEILGCRIHKLLLQPIVENAIVHGLKGSGSEQLLIIKIDKFQDRLLKIEIIDNGMGIPKDKLESILNNRSGGGIGLKNVYERLNIYYKDSADMTIISEQNVGTTVTLIIPTTYSEEEIY